MGKLVMGLLAVCLLVGGVYWLWSSYYTSELAMYAGGEIFTTEEEYKDFKAYCLLQQNEILDIAVLASEPPIYVKYELVVPRGTFPYAYSQCEGQISTWTSVLSACMAAFGMGLGTLVVVVSLATKGEGVKEDDLDKYDRR